MRERKVRGQRADAHSYILKFSKQWDDQDSEGTLGCLE